MNHNYIISALEQNNSVLHSLLRTVPEELIIWRPADDKWNLLEIICHLYDEEREDFRSRLKHVLEKPEEMMPKIDPLEWVISRNYSKKNYFETLTDFEYERKISVEWLRSLTNPSWENVYIHPKAGPLSAKLFLNNWLAHDYLHIRQITRLKYEYLRINGRQPLDYAGTW